MTTITLPLNEDNIWDVLKPEFDFIAFDEIYRLSAFEFEPEPKKKH